MRNYAERLKNPTNKLGSGYSNNEPKLLILMLIANKEEKQNFSNTSKELGPEEDQEL